ncbi:hypothetical protein, partial [Klebsiella quasipneumoniae]|uniref:hypothetical protein n=1 Tax=Klebsiella quasipneumoniae TaxID=1463165 RepID=UPI001FCB0769
KRAYCLKTQPATGETYPKSDLFNKALNTIKDLLVFGGVNVLSALLGKTLCAIILSIRSPSKLKSTLAITLSLLVSSLSSEAYEISNAYAKNFVIC